MTKFSNIACLAEYFTVDPKAKSLHGFFSNHYLNSSRSTEPLSLNAIPFFITNLSDTDIGFDVEGNPLSYFFLAISRHIYC